MTQKKFWVIVGGAGAALFFLSLLYILLGSRLGKRGEELKKLQAELKTARETILFSQKGYEEPIFLPTQKELPLVMDEMTELGKSLGIDFRSIRPGEIGTDSSGSLVVPVEMTVVSTYKELGQFIGALAALKRGLVVVDSFGIGRDQALLPRLQCHLRVKVVLRPS